jgi:hypothetical protein
MLREVRDVHADFGIAMIFYYLQFLPIFMESVGIAHVCGCGGLAETAGDSFRHLSSKTETSWKIELDDTRY